METSLESLRIKFLEVEYREMTLGHTQCSWTTWDVWLPDYGWPAMMHPWKDGGNCLWSLVSWVACSTGTVFYDTLSVFSRHMFTCALSLCSHQWPSFHCTATTAYIMIIFDCSWQWLCLFISDPAHDCTDCLCVKVSTVMQVQPWVHPISCQRSLSLSRKQPWNLKPLHSRRCGHFREAQSADCLM